MYLSCTIQCFGIHVYGRGELTLLAYTLSHAFAIFPHSLVLVEFFLLSHLMFSSTLEGLCL